MLLFDLVLRTRHHGLSFVQMLSVDVQMDHEALEAKKLSGASELAFDIDDYSSQKQRRALKVMSGHGGYGKISPNFSLQVSSCD